jgi:two-component system chemotaxis sensor kinase CheA
MTDDMISEFVAEASDHLTRAEEILLGFSRQPDEVDAEAINACFRSLHTIKGCAGFLDLVRIQQLAHAGEQVLDALRTNDLNGSLAVFDALLQAVGRLQVHISILNGQPTTLPETDADCIQLLEEVRKVSLPTAPASVTDSAGAQSDEVVMVVNASLAQLIVIGASDAAGVAEVLAGLAQRMLQGAWSAAARPLMTRMRQLADRLGGPDAGAHFTAILELCMQLESAQRELSLTSAVVAADDADDGADDGGGDGEASGVLGEFVSEATELLNHAESVVVAGLPLSAEQVNGVFRAFHTVKGMAAYLSLPVVEQEAHRLEAQIQEVRDQVAPADEGFIAIVLCGVDSLRELVTEVKRRVATGASRLSAAVPVPAAVGSAAPASVSVAASPSAVISPKATSAPAKANERIGDLLTDLGVPRDLIEQTAAGLKPGERLGDRLVADGAATRQQVDKAASAQHQLKSGGEVFSRVATAKLEELMNQVGELLIAQAMVQHSPELIANSQLAQGVARQGRILRNLQVLSLSLRMVPLRGTFQKMARVVYDTAKKLGKQVEFSLGGEDTEIDRTLAETMGDPLMHMVRNGIDHGIEMPEVRLAAGKPAAGRLRLEAFQAGDDVVIRLIDDGAGMDPQRLRAKAIEKGLIDPAQAMDEQACFQLVFLPGFSTAAKVTDVSGRGVGMDVVRRQVEEADGTVHITSVVGQGTTFTIRLPMTTAILDAMQLKVGTESMLMPISSIVEMMRPKAGQVQTILERGQVIRYRERMLPLVHLGTTFDISSCIVDPEQSTLVVIDNHGDDFVIQVDAILGQRQVVIKPFDEGLAHHPATSGTTILGDGRVALILNPACLVRGSAATEHV